MTCFASARLFRLGTVRAIRAASDHANRLDSASQERVRSDGDTSLNMHFTPWSDRTGPQDGSVDYVRDFRAMTLARSISDGYGAAPVSHLVCIVSSEWIHKTGDIHDPNNSRNRQLFETSIAWAQHLFGADALLAARMDMDEVGGGVVDCFVAPIATSRRGTRYLSISPRLQELRIQYHRRKSFEALQDSWAEFVQTRLDPSIERGKAKEGVGSDRLTPENFAAKAKNEIASKELHGERTRFESESAALAAERSALEASKSAILVEGAALVHGRSAFVAEVAKRTSDLVLLEAAATARVAAERDEILALARPRIENLRDRARLDGRAEGLKEARKLFRSGLAEFLAGRLAFETHSDRLEEVNLVAAADDDDLVSLAESVRAAGLDIVFARIENVFRVIGVEVDVVRDKLSGLSL
jgi:hypothetical protein